MSATCTLIQIGTLRTISGKPRLTHARERSFGIGTHRIGRTIRCAGRAFVNIYADGAVTAETFVALARKVAVAVDTGRVGRTLGVSVRALTTGRAGFSVSTEAGVANATIRAIGIGAGCVGRAPGAP